MDGEAGSLGHSIAFHLVELREVMTPGREVKLQALLTGGRCQANTVSETLNGAPIVLLASGIKDDLG